VNTENLPDTDVLTNVEAKRICDIMYKYFISERFNSNKIHGDDHVLQASY